MPSCHCFTTGPILLLTAALGLLVVGLWNHYRGGRNAPTASNLNRAGEESAGRPYKFTGKYGPNARWDFGTDAMYFEPASEGGEAFVSRGRGASLWVDGKEVVVALRSQKSGVRRAVVSGQSSVVSPKENRTADHLRP